MTLTACPCNPVRLLFSELVTSFDLGNKGAQMRGAASAARSCRSKSKTLLVCECVLKHQWGQHIVNSCPSTTLDGPLQTTPHWRKRSLWFRRGWDRQHPLAHCELNGSLPSSARTLCYGAGRLKIVCAHVSLHHLQIHMHTLFVHTEIFFKEFWSHLYISASSGTDTF